MRHERERPVHSVKTQTSIDQIVLSNFLDTGGCLRWRSTQTQTWVVWEGGEISNNTENCEEFSVFTSSFFLNKSSFVRPKKVAFVSADVFKKWLQAQNVPKKTNSRTWLPPSSTSFQESFTYIQDQIQKEILKKALPIAFSHSPSSLQQEEHLTALLKLLDLPETLLPYGHWEKGEGFLGATPEVLFSIEQNHLKTMALAGTASLQRTSEDFMQDPKELKEHQFVIDNLRQVLEPLGKANCGPTHVLKLPHLQHLLTELSVPLSTIPSWVELIEMFHPTAALGTVPRSHWKELINLPEQQSRRSFGAPFGVRFSPDSQLALVGIRQFQWNSAEIRIGAGCGIVKESIFDREWQELLLKIESVKKVFGWA